MGVVRRLVAGWIPGPATLAAVAPLAAGWAAAGAWVAGRLRVHRGVPAPYTRKVFHFLVFTAAGLVHLAWGRAGVVVYGGVVAAAVLYAVWRGDGDPFYEAMARPSDAPRRTLFVLVPLASTAVGGVLANLFFPAHATIGYLVCGWGDAIGEPVGVRWGRREYRVPSLAGVPAVRTLEGSAAVAVAGTSAAAAGLWLAGADFPAAAGTAAAVGAVATIVEAVSHHGTDNLTLQLAAAGTAALLA